MGLVVWAEKKIKNLSLWDFSILKTAFILFGIIVGAYISDFVRSYVWHFIVVFLVLYAVLLYRVLR